VCARAPWRSGAPRAVCRGTCPEVKYPGALRHRARAARWPTCLSVCLSELPGAVRRRRTRRAAPSMECGSYGWLPCKHHRVLLCMRGRTKSAQLVSVKVAFLTAVWTALPQNSILRTPYKASAVDHYLKSYKRAFTAVCLAQFRGKGFRHGTAVGGRGRSFGAITHDSVAWITVGQTDRQDLSLWTSPTACAACFLHGSNACPG
jgi:hypothetical protein